jgi:hypothetical protein
MLLCFDGDAHADVPTSSCLFDGYTFALLDICNCRAIGPEHLAYNLAVSTAITNGVYDRSLRYCGGELQISDRPGAAVVLHCTTQVPSLADTAGCALQDRSALASTLARSCAGVVLLPG